MIPKIVFKKMVLLCTKVNLIEEVFFMKLLEADTKNLEYLLSLSYGTLNIPYSQRPYEWEKGQVSRLFKDFYSVYLDPESTHVLNFITIRIDEDESNTKYIYDGQQRTITSLLILTAIVNELKKLDSDAKDSADALTRLFLYTSHWKKTSDINYKIIFENDEANNMLHKFIFKSERLPKDYILSDYDNAIYNNYNYIIELIHQNFGSSPTKDQLSDFAESIIKRVLVIIIETSFENIAEEMFETLNSTGLQLEDFYVLKNRLVRTLGEGTVKPVWSTIEFNTDRISKGKFLSAYVNTIKGKTPSNNLYTRIADKKKLTNIESATVFLDELAKASDIFLKIEKPSQKLDGTEKENLQYAKAIKTLTLLSANQYKPVIIAMGLKNFSSNDVNIILTKIISLQIRNIFISDFNANTLEQFYPSLAKEIYEGKYTQVEQIKKQISNITENDSTIYEHFNNKVIKTTREESIIRFILKEIYNFENPEIKINESSLEVNLEHILPKNPNEDSQWLVNFQDEEFRFNTTRKIGT